MTQNMWHQTCEIYILDILFKPVIWPLNQQKKTELLYEAPTNSETGVLSYILLNGNTVLDTNSSGSEITFAN